jgi:hypothetical protein
VGGGFLRNELLSRKEIVMKKMVLGFVLALAALALMVSPALAEPGSSPAAPRLSAADQEVLVSLATPAPTLAAKRPAIEEKALCTATVNCGTTSLTCSSSVNGASCSSVDRHCPIQRGSITCNGFTTLCPYCPIAQSN